MRLVAVIAVLCALVAMSQAAPSVPPAFQGVLGQKGADYIGSVIVPLVVSRLGNLNLPDMSGKKDTFDYTVSSITVNSVSFGDVAINLQSDFSLEITGVSVSMHANWKFREHIWPHIPFGSGDVDVSISDSSISVALTTSMTPTGEPQVQVASTSCSLNTINVSVHHSLWSWLFDLIVDLFKGAIRTAAQAAIEKQTTDMFNVVADKALASLKLAVPVGKIAVLDFHLVEAPAFPNDDLVLLMRGEVVNASNPVDAPLPHAALPVDTPTNMVAMYLDQFLVNSGLWVYFNDGAFTVWLTDSKLPHNFPLHLNTSDFAMLIPQLYEAYPAQMFELVINATTNPLIEITPGGAVVHANIDTNWLVNIPDNPTSALVTNLDLMMEAKLGTRETNVTLQLAFLNMSLTVASSSVGHVDPTLLNTLLNAIIGPIVDIFNAALADGIPLPMVDGLSFVNTDITQGDGFLYIGTDLSYSPPSQVLDALDVIREAGNTVALP